MTASETKRSAAAKETKRKGGEKPKARVPPFVELVLEQLDLGPRGQMVIDRPGANAIRNYLNRLPREGNERALAGMDLIRLAYILMKDRHSPQAGKVLLDLAQELALKTAPPRADAPRHDSFD